MRKIMKISWNKSANIIGAGNMGFRLGLALAERGYEIKAVWNRSRENGEKLVRALNKNISGTIFADEMENLPHADITIIAVSDDAIRNTAELLHKAGAADDTILVHTSGATDISVLDFGHNKYGVLYPLMTLSKSKSMDFGLVPFLLEASDNETGDILASIATDLKAEYKFMSSEKRLKMHTAAVFSCNFTSYMLSLAYDLTKENPVFLLPLTIETVRKFYLMLNPDLTVTGPARRGDIKTMERHIELLQRLGKEEHREVYEFLSGKIYDNYNVKNKQQNK